MKKQEQVFMKLTTRGLWMANNPKWAWRMMKDSGYLKWWAKVYFWFKGI